MALKTTFGKLPAGHITGIAGVPYQDGIPAKEAHVGWPIGVVRRADGDLIVADWQANRYWRIDQDGILHAFAGGNVPGNSGDGGPAIEARFRGPHSLTLDSEGNYYTADLSNNTIRRIDASTGVITRVAGSGRTGHGGDGGPALEAEFDVHCGMAVDEDGNLFVSSEWQNTIRKVDAESGIIQHFAGHDGRHYPSERENSKPYVGKGLEDWGGLTWGGYHGDGGPAREASFFHPEHLAFDSKGDLYVCDNSNHRIRKIEMATGMITTVLGNGIPASNGDGGPATEASTLMPDAICLDAHDNLFVGEKYGYRVRKVDAVTGIVITLVGNGVPGWGEEDLHGSETTCNSVEAGICADPDGTVHWCDCSGRVRRYDGATGMVTTVLGGTSIHDGEPAQNAFLCAPTGINVGADGNIYFADFFNQRIRAIDTAGIIRTVAGNGARAYGGDGGPGPEAYLSNPHGVSVDSRGRIVIADTRHGYVRRVDEDGIITTIAGTGFQWDKGDGGPASSACMLAVNTVAHGPDDDIYLADGTIGRIRRIDSGTNIITTVAGIGEIGYSGDGGPATQARIGAVNAICFDRQGNMYLADSSNHAVRMVTTDGIITTIAGTGEPGFSADGTIAVKAQLNNPNGIAVGTDGIVYVCDTNNNRVRRIAPDGTLETIAGCDIQGDSGDDGPATQACLNNPYSICLYGDDILLITDYFNNRIRAIKL
jgi:sugar lactone lactonase YvrE